MKERPILFSAPMVRAILDGSKTQTRRLVKPQPHVSNGFTWWHDRRNNTDTGTGGGAPGWFLDRCPYGQPGDQLWVRETFCDARNAESARFLYRASGDAACRWTPSIHMPRAASRITLRITSVRVERLQKCGPADATAEGVITKEWQWYEYGQLAPLVSFSDLWDDINGPGSWDANPWVWVVEFKRVV